MTHCDFPKRLYSRGQGITSSCSRREGSRRRTCSIALERSSGSGQHVGSVPQSENMPGVRSTADATEGTVHSSTAAPAVERFGGWLLSNRKRSDESNRYLGSAVEMSLRCHWPLAALGHLAASSGESATAESALRTSVVQREMPQVSLSPPCVSVQQHCGSHGATRVIGSCYAGKSSRNVVAWRALRPDYSLPAARQGLLRCRSDL
jgi:hypothetical protein